MVITAALAIVLIGGVRNLTTANEVFAVAGDPGDVLITEGPVPPLQINAPRLRPLAVIALAQQPPALQSDAQAPDVQANVVEPTATALPTTLPTPLPTPVPALELPTPAVATTLHQAPLPATQLTGLNHAWQTWNNCGPATLAMNMSYYGSSLNQADIGNVLRRYADDKNVSPEELVAFAQSQGYMAQLRVNGSAELARTFLSNGIPLLIETWLEEDPGDGLGHYRLLVGHDDSNARWIGYDSYVSTSLVSADAANYQGIYMSYEQTEDWWKIFNRAYVLVYPPDRDPLVRSILGAAYDPAVMWQEARTRAESEIAANPADAYAHFNLGTVLVEQGDYAGAAASYDQARALGLPWRMLWYQFGPFEAYTQMGRYQEVIDLGQATLTSAAGGIEEIHYWRGHAMAGLGNVANAQAEWNQALTLNPDFAPAQQALAGVPLGAN